MGSITDVPGIRVGHWTDPQAATGCTVVLCEDGAVAGVDVRGLAPGTRETDLLRPGHLVQQVHAILLSGGSAFGLAAADGVMRYLEERGVGFETGVARVPIVPAAILFDLILGDPAVRPGPTQGYAACLAATDGPVEEGNVGAGTGATVGKILGPGFMMKAGLGSASVQLGGGVIVGALVAVNALGDVVDPTTGQILAGARHPSGKGFLDTSQALRGDLTHTILGFTPWQATDCRSTTLAVVATDAALTREQANVVAMMAHDGIARAIRPAHTMLDGDAIFVLSTGQVQANVTVVGAAATEVVAQAIVRAVLRARSLHGVPAHSDLVSQGGA